MSEPQQPPAQPYGQQQPPQPAGQSYPNEPGRPYPPQAQPGQPYPPQAQPGQPYPPQAQPGQPYPAHAQPGQPYPQPGQPYPRAGQQAGQAANSLGRIAFIISVAALAVGLLLTLVTPFLYAGGDFELAGSVHGVLGILLFLAHAAALILAIIAVRRPGSKLLAGIAIGISGAAVVSQVFNWISQLFYAVI